MIPKISLKQIENKCLYFPGVPKPRGAISPPKWRACLKLKPTQRKTELQEEKDKYEKCFQHKNLGLSTIEASSSPKLLFSCIQG